MLFPQVCLLCKDEPVFNEFKICNRCLGKLPKVKSQTDNDFLEEIASRFPPDVKVHATHAFLNYHKKALV